ncbi:MAG: hypothetical protein AB1650_00345 [Candidatus Omnitrophota bacterium]
MQSKKKNILIVLFLSFIPGLPQFYLGLSKKAASLFIIDAALFLSFFLTHSYVSRLLAVVIYLITFFPAAIESHQIARYGENRIDTSAKWYVIALLLTTGFSALPLLWQSEHFSRQAKMIWTAAVPILAAIFFTGLIKYWSHIERIIQSALTGRT